MKEKEISCKNCERVYDVFKEDAKRLESGGENIKRMIGDEAYNALKTLAKNNFRFIERVIFG